MIAFELAAAVRDRIRQSPEQFDNTRPAARIRTGTASTTTYSAAGWTVLLFGARIDWHRKTVVSRAPGRHVLIAYSVDAAGLPAPSIKLAAQTLLGLDGPTAARLFAADADRQQVLAVLDEILDRAGAADGP